MLNWLENVRGFSSYECEQLLAGRTISVTIDSDDTEHIYVRLVCGQLIIID